MKKDILHTIEDVLKGYNTDLVGELKAAPYMNDDDGPYEPCTCQLLFLPEDQAFFECELLEERFDLPFVSYTTPDEIVRFNNAKRFPDLYGDWVYQPSDQEL